MTLCLLRLLHGKHPCHTAAVFGCLWHGMGACGLAGETLAQTQAVNIQKPCCEHRLPSSTGRCLLHTTSCLTSTLSLLVQPPATSWHSNFAARSCCLEHKSAQASKHLLHADLWSRDGVPDACFDCFLRQKLTCQTSHISAAMPVQHSRKGYPAHT